MYQHSRFIQILLGGLLGFVIALAIAAASVASVFLLARYLQRVDLLQYGSPREMTYFRRLRLYGKVEQRPELWKTPSHFLKAILELIASIMIFVLGLSMLKLDRGTYKLEKKFH